ncbi:MAG TPA: ROK family protein [Anaerolineaceae bacterium]|nr:ROK family protein [Anaerolineaceae bacterium]
MPHLRVTPLEIELIGKIRRAGEITKADLVSNTIYSRSKISSCIAGLVNRKFIKPAGAGGYTGGRRSVKFSVNGDLGLVAGVDIGATSIDIVLADLSGKICARYGEPASIREGPVAVLDRVCVLLDQMIGGIGWKTDHLFGIGIGVPGPVDFMLGTVFSPPIMPGWDSFPIVQTVQDRYPIARAVVDNDVNVMALGEKYRGLGKELQNFIFVKIGTGIGAGIICSGEIYRGNNGCAGDIGHISVKKDGPLCPCGNSGCLEAMAAGPAIAERGVKAALDGSSPILKKHYDTNGGRLRAEDVGLAAGEGDAASIEIIRSSGQMIGDVLAGLVNFYNPGMIVIAGGVSNLGNLLLSSIRQAVLSRSLPLATRDLQIVFSAIGADAGVVGAMMLAIENVFLVNA